MHFRRSASFCIIFIFLFGVAWSGVIEIPKDAETIQEGINIASNLDTLLVDPGIYLENIDFLSKEIVIYAYAGPQSTMLVPASPTDFTVAIRAGERSTTKLIGFDISGGHTNHVVFIDSGASPTIEGNIFHHNLEPEIYDKAIVACWGDSCNPLICRNIFYDNNGITTIWIQKGKGDVLNNTLAYNRTAMMCNTGLAVAYNNIVSFSYQTAVDGVWADFDYNNMYENNGDFG